MDTRWACYDSAGSVGLNPITYGPSIEKQMTDTTSSTTVIQLFRKWRSGDEAAGQEMAQRFSDWYYAISTIRVPGTVGRPPMESACQQFAQGIVTVTRPRALVDWAHEILEKELRTSGYGLDAMTPTGSDHPNAMTRNRSPSELLESVAASVPADLLNVLALAYDSETSLATVDAAAEALGGTPFAMLQARYAIKRALRTSQDVPFAVAPDEADMDRAPISLYEANRLASGKEIGDLEKWLLSDIDLCKDIAEFSAFVHALRGGALSQYATAPAATSEAPPRPTPNNAPTRTTQPTPQAPASAPDPLPAGNEPKVQKTPQQEATPEPDIQPPAAAPPPAKTGAMRATLVTVATVVAMVVLLAMIIVFVLRG